MNDKLRSCLEDIKDSVLRIQEEIDLDSEAKLNIELQGGTMTCEDIEATIAALRSDYYKWELTIKWQS